MARPFITIFLFTLLVGVTSAQLEEEAPLHALLNCTKMPSGYKAIELEPRPQDKDKLVMIMVTKADVVSKVLVGIELRDLSGAEARRTATKSYINALANSLKTSGYKIVSKKVPDVDKEQFTLPVEADLEVENSEGMKLFAHEEVFFTDKGFFVQVIAEDTKSLATLKAWARTIRPKTL